MMTQASDAAGTTACPPPRIAGVVPLADGRDLAFAEFGDPHGVPVIWLHGTPGSCRQVAPAAAIAATSLGVRIIGLARPGAGHSTPAHYRTVSSIVPDVEQMADRLGLDRFSVVGLSGGGPYTLALGAQLHDRVAGLCVMGGVAPTVGPDAPGGGVIALSSRFQPVLRYSAEPLARGLNRLLRPLIPHAERIGDAFFGFLPEGDRKVFETPGVKEMFIGDIALSLTDGHGSRAMIRDAVLFGRHWGFDLADVTVPVTWWHGDEDWCVSLAHAEWVVARLPDATLHVIAGGSHLTGYAAADGVVTTARSYHD